MFSPIKLVDIELGAPLPSLQGLEGHDRVQALVRLHGTPLGWVGLGVHAGACPADAFAHAIAFRYGEAIVRHGLHDALAGPVPAQLWGAEELLEQAHPDPSAPLPRVTVAVCTRDRPADLALCLDAAARLDYADVDLLVVDNAPASDATERLVRNSYRSVRYVYEPRPGLNWARNRAVLEARGEVIAFTDDDVCVDPGWARAFGEVFAENPEVMAVTGLVVPYELETRAQFLFEQYDGFGRGFERKWVRVDREGGERAAARHGNTGKYGTGANMAYRRSLFPRSGYFDPALDVGTVTRGGGDLDMLFRVLKGGHLLVYDPRAMVRHRHRREYAALRSQVENWGVGMYSYVVRNALAYPEERLMFLRLGLWNLSYRFTRRLLTSLFHRRYPPQLNLRELRGALVGMRSYPQARLAASRIATRFGPQVPNLEPERCGPARSSQGRRRTTLRNLDLSRPLEDLEDVVDFASVRLSLSWKGASLGSASIRNLYRPVSRLRLRDAISAQLPLKCVGLDHRRAKELVRRRILTTALARPG